MEIDFEKVNYHIQGEQKKTDTFAANLNNKSVSFFLLTLYKFDTLEICKFRTTISSAAMISTR